MASTAQVSEVSKAAPVAKVPMGSLLVVGTVSMILAVGASTGAQMYLAHQGKAAGVANARVAAAEKAEKSQELPTHNVVLEPLLVNLADDDGHAYLRLGVTLAETEEKNAKAEEKPAAGADAAVRDAMLGVLGRKRSAELLAPGGKENLKAELKQALDQQVPKARVQAVYFTDFLVQQ